MNNLILLAAIVFNEEYGDCVSSISFFRVSLRYNDTLSMSYNARSACQSLACAIAAEVRTCVRRAR